jgi:hypothetical protein
MKSVRRFELTHGLNKEAVQHAYGKYVEFADYESLEQERQYHMNAINRLAKALNNYNNGSGTSDDIINYAVKELSGMRSVLKSISGAA